MTTKRLLILVTALIFALALLCPAFAESAQPVQLPEPKLDQSKSLVQALKDRKSVREYSPESLSDQTLSNLLWAAFGVSRPDSGKRTAPSAYNRQEIDVYVAKADGMFLYDAKANTLIPVVSEDLRSLTGTQSYFKDAPVNLVYVADFAKMGDSDENTKMFIAAADTGFVAENVYLYCASADLANVFRASIDKPKLAKAMNLRPDQRIISAHTVGKPKAGK